MNDSIQPIFAANRHALSAADGGSRTPRRRGLSIRVRTLAASGRMTPSQLASMMIVASRASHAVVNAVLKAGSDKMASRALIDGLSAALLAPVAFIAPLPHGAWGWLAASGLVHLA
jgi:hypothetical protein